MNNQFLSVTLCVLLILVGCNTSEVGSGEEGNDQEPADDGSSGSTPEPSSIAQQAYLKASNAWIGDTFGYYVDLEGDTLVVGAPFEDGDADSTPSFPNDNANEAGAVYVFVQSDEGWKQQAYLKSSDAAANKAFGKSFSLDDNTLVVMGDNRAHVFIRKDGVWSEETYIDGPFSAAVSLDGDTLALGSYGDDGDSSSTVENPNYNATQSGAVYIYQRHGDAWTLQAFLKAGNAKAYEFFGGSVDLDRDTLAVGASYLSNIYNTNYSGGEAVYIFTRNGNAWTQQDYLKASNAVSNIGFGSSIALDGDTLIVGASGEDGDSDSTAEAPNYNAADSGAAYVFIRNGDDWNQQAYLKASNAGPDHQFGKSVALDSNNLVLGAIGEPGDTNSTQNNPNEYFSGRGSGAAYVFVLKEGVWKQINYLKASNAGYEDRFGFSISLDGDTIAVGATIESGDSNSTVANPNNNADGSGAAYIFNQVM